MSNRSYSPTATSTCCSSPIKIASPAIWCWGGFTTSSYNLPDDTYALTYRQMAVKVNLQKESAENFVKKASLPKLKVRINQSFEGIVCPLATVAAYWKYLDSANIGSSDIARAGWMAIEDYLANRQNSNPLPGASQIATAVYDLSILPDSPKLQVLIFESEEYRISTESAFMLIGVSPKWLNKIQPRTRAELIKEGFGGTNEECYVIDPEDNAKPVNTIELKDCLAIWEYFAKRKHTPAIACLKALVLEPLQQRILKLEQTNCSVSH